METLRYPYGCTVCMKPFVTPVFLLKHIELSHPLEKPTKTSSKVKIEKSETNSLNDEKNLPS